MDATTQRTGTSEINDMNASRQGRAQARGAAIAAIAVVVALIPKIPGAQNLIANNPDTTGAAAGVTLAAGGLALLWKKVIEDNDGPSLIEAFQTRPIGTTALSATTLALAGALGANFGSKMGEETKNNPFAMSPPAYENQTPTAQKFTELACSNAAPGKNIIAKADGQEWVINCP